MGVTEIVSVLLSVVPMSVKYRIVDNKVHFFTSVHFSQFIFRSSFFAVQHFLRALSECPVMPSSPSAALDAQRIYHNIPVQDLDLKSQYDEDYPPPHSNSYRIHVFYRHLKMNLMHQ